jgi:hypothetical protein
MTETVICSLCSDELREEQRDSPFKSDDGDPVCDRCYHEKFEGVCDRCRDVVEKKELAMRPGEILALWEETDGLKTGYYRVLRWPIYMDGMIDGYIVTDNLQRLKPLDEAGIAAADDAYTPGGRLCAACQKEIQP